MKLTEAEWQIMNALWQDHPATARDIADRLPAGVSWAYTTIKTMLTRLVDKQAVSEAKQGKASVYRPLLSQKKARLGAFKSLVDQAFGGAMGPLVHCLVEEKNLTTKQQKQLLNLLAEDRDKGGQS